MFHVKHGIVACEANGICADAARAHKRVDTKVCPQATKPFFRAVRGLNEYHPLVNYPFPFRKHGENRRAADRCEKENGSRVTLAWLSKTIRSSQINYCYTCRLFYAGAT